MPTEDELEELVTELTDGKMLLHDMMLLYDMIAQGRMREVKQAAQKASKGGGVK